MAESPVPSRRLARFGAFEVDLRAGEIRKNGLKVRIQEQPFQILSMLLAHSGEVITRDDIRQKLWPADTFVDFDHGLNNAVNRLREALGDSAEKPRFVETVARRGYRFVAAVDGARQVAPPTSTDAPASPAPHLAPALPFADAVTGVQAAAAPLFAERRRPQMLAIGAGALVALLGLLIGLNVGGWRQKLRDRVSPVRIQSVAVLPLENLTGDPAQEYFADGMTDALITELAQTQALRVISRTSAMQYKGAMQSKGLKGLLPQIASELNVDVVVEGTVRRSGDRVWITAQLIEARADRHLWARSYERELRDVPVLQTEMARDIVREMHIELTPQERTRMVRAHSVNPQAYDDYLRGRFYAANSNKADTDTAIELLERAITTDPEFALAHAAIAYAYFNKSGLFEPQEKQWQEQALTSANKALALEPDLAEAHLARAMVLAEKTEFDVAKKVEEFRRALSLNPNLDEAHHLLGSFYNHIGLLDKASDEEQKAIAINPANTGARYRVGINLLFQCKYEQAVTVFAGTRRFAPSLWGFHMALALFHLGRRDEATAVVSQSLRDLPQDEGGLLAGMQAMLAAAAGEERTAEERINRALEVGRGYRHFHHTAYAVASAYALMHKPEPAVKWLRTAADDGFPCYPFFAKDTSLDNLRTNPQFIEFMAKLKQQWEQYNATL